MKITTLIPAYKPDFFLDVIKSLLIQTYKPTRVIISDDSKDDLIIKNFSRFIKEFNNKGIEVELIKGPKKGGHQNIRHLINYAGQNDDAYHIYFDDDYIFPHFYQTHALILNGIPELKSSISKRIYVDSMNSLIPGYGCPDFITHSQSRFILLNKETLYPSTIPVMHNWLGEMSNIVLRKETLFFLDDFKLDGICCYGLGDIGLFLKLSESPKGILYINDNLSAFRLSEKGTTSQFDSFDSKASLFAWVCLAIYANRRNFLDSNQAIQSYKTVKDYYYRHKYNQEEHDLQEALEMLINKEQDADDNFLWLWDSYLQDYINTPL